MAFTALAPGENAKKKSSLSGIVNDLIGC